MNWFAQLRVAGHRRGRRRVSPEALKERRETAIKEKISLWYVYFLELSNGDIYVGSTDDLRRRLHLISKAVSFPRANTCRQFFARMWRLQMK